LIKGHRIVLRAVEKDDIARWRVWFNDPEVRRNLHRVYPYGTADGEQFYEFQRTSETDKVFADAYPMFGCFGLAGRLVKQ